MIYGYRLSNGTISCDRVNSNEVFLNDNFTYENEKYKILVEGVLLNLKEVKEKNSEDIFNVIIEAYEKKNIERLFKGSYLICIIDKEMNNLSLINDLLSKKSLFYYKEEDFYFSTSFFNLVETLKKQKKALSIDNIGISMIKNFGRFYDDYTYLKEIKFLKPFNSILNGNLQVAQKKKVKIIEENVIETIDNLFEKAVALQYSKNKENGKIQVASISGGMDSKNLFLYAKKLGFNDDLMFTYAEEKSLDFIIAKKIAKDYCIPFKYYSLQKGNFMFDLRKELCEMSECQMSYFGTTGLLYAIKDFSDPNIGIIHTGIGGGELFGDILSIRDSNQEIENFVRKSKLEIKEENELLDKIVNQYQDYNDFIKMNIPREAPAFQKIVESKYEAMSPYLEEDFFEYMCNVDTKMLRGEKNYRILYCKWVDEKASNKYRTTKIRLKHNSSILRYPRAIICHIKRKMNLKTKYDMNPFWYWERKNKLLLASLKKQLSEETKKMYNKGIKIKLKGENLIEIGTSLTISYALLKIYGDD